MHRRHVSLTSNHLLARGILLFGALSLIACSSPEHNSDNSSSSSSGQGGAPSTGGCATLVIDKSSAACKGVTWTGTVWPALHGTCATKGCHDDGNGTGVDPYLPASDAAASFKNLEGVSFACGPYVSSSAPEKSQILNNLQGKEGAGLKMPIAMSLDEDLIDTITTWVKCGEPQ